MAQNRISGFLSITLSLALLGLTSCAPAGKDSGFSAERLDRIDSVMKNYVDEGKMPGMVALVARNGEVAYHKSFGMQDIDRQTPMPKDAIFRIASMSKAVTSVAVMMLYEEGHFLLTDPVSKYIPEFSDPQVMVRTPESGESILVPAKSEITIRQLLNHTSGITYGKGLLKEYYEPAGMTVGLTPPEGALGEMIRKLGGFPLIAHPGEEFNYGKSVDVLGYLVEVISGLPLDQFLEERIFKPLKMKDTGFNLPEEKLPRLAGLYGLDEDGKLEKLQKYVDYTKKQEFFSGGAGLLSTPLDYLQFAQMLLNKGELNGIRLLSRKTVEMMTSNSIGDIYIWESFAHNGIMGDKFGLGLGIRTERGTYDELESLGIFGWDGAFYTRFWVDPSESMIGIFMSQVEDNWEEKLIGKYRVLVYQAIDD